MLHIVKFSLVSLMTAIATVPLDYGQEKDRTLILNYFNDMQEFSWIHKELEAQASRDREQLKKDIAIDRVEAERDPQNFKPLSAEIYETEFSRLLRWIQKSHKMYAHGLALYDCSGALVGFAEGVAKHDSELFPLLLNDDVWVSLTNSKTEYQIDDIPHKKSLKYLTWVLRTKDKIIGVVRVVVHKKKIPPKSIS